MRLTTLHMDLPKQARPASGIEIVQASTCRCSELFPEGYTQKTRKIQASRVAELRDEVETAFDLLTALDLAGDGIGGDAGYGISAVALAARSALDNARSMIEAMNEGRQTGMVRK